MSVEQLVARKDDLVEALRVLERDRESGAIDPAAYALARDRYEREAAALLERLDQERRETAPLEPHGRPRSRLLIVLLTAGAVILAIVLLLVGALRTRGTGESVTGVQPPTVPAVPSNPAVRKAESAVAAHDRSPSAWTALGQAQLAAGDDADGESALKTALKLDPGAPGASVLLAVALGSSGQQARALQYLRLAERAYPTAARVWFADGVIASRARSTLPRAIAAFKRFLRLQPRSPVAPQARTLLQTAERVARR